MSLPAKTSFKTTGFGIRLRELIITCVSLFFGLAILAVPLGSIFLRILLAAGTAAGGVLVAFWRVERTWTIEAYWLNRLKYQSRPRRFVKGGVGREGLNSSDDTPEQEAQPDDPRQRGRGSKIRSEPLLWLPERWSPQSNREVFGLALCVFSLTVFLGWMVGTNGIENLESHLKVLVFTVFNQIR